MVMYIDNYILNPMRLNKKKKLDWYHLWIKKSDYITNYYNNIKGKYEIIDESIDYYLVMLEMGIYYLKDYSDYSDYVFVQHNILLDTGLKYDIKERDFAEYIKYLFYNNSDINYVYDLIEKSINKYNYYLVVARLLFPSYYLYYFERVITENIDYDMLKNIVNRSSEYEVYLKNIVFYMNKYLIKKIVLPF